MDVAQRTGDIQMGTFAKTEPDTFWLNGLIRAMDEVTDSTAIPAAEDRSGLATRLELPALALAPSPADLATEMRP